MKIPLKPMTTCHSKSPILPSRVLQQSDLLQIQLFASRGHVARQELAKFANVAVDVGE